MTARLLISCPDRPGIVASVSSFLFRHGANIVSFDMTWRVSHKLHLEDRALVYENKTVVF